MPFQLLLVIQVMGGSLIQVTPIICLPIWISLVLAGL